MKKRFHKWWRALDKASRHPLLVAIIRVLILQYLD